MSTKIRVDNLGWGGGGGGGGWILYPYLGLDLPTLPPLDFRTRHLSRGGGGGGCTYVVM